MTRLLAELTAAAQRSKSCRYVEATSELTAEERAALERLLAKPHTEVPATKIGSILRDNDISITDETVQEHRRGACPCPSS